MKKFNFLILLFSILTFSQDRKGEFMLTKDSKSHTMYVAFTSLNSKQDKVFEEILKSNSNFRNIVSEERLSFDNTWGISSQKKSEMLISAKKNRNNSNSIEKLNRIYRVTLPKSDNEHLLQLAKKLETFSEVDYVSLISNDPIEPPYTFNIKKESTPSLESLQTYLFQDPGINVAYAWSLGVAGEGIKIRDVEYGYNGMHETLINRNNLHIEPGFQLSPQLIYPSGAYYDWLDHGTAVASIIFAGKENFGVSGAVHKADEFVSFLEWTSISYDRAAAVARSIDASSAGDIIMYEMQTGGRNNYYVPAEFNNLIWDLTKAATDSGITIIAAAGNGSEDLDHPYYNSYNQRGNSGAIIVGAGTPDVDHSIVSFSTYGNRVNLQGWGYDVLSAGYGYFAQYDNDYNRTYIYFSGTSSATPVVTSAFALVQSFYHKNTGSYLSSEQLLDLFVETGYPQGGNTTKKIGPLPNVQKAIEKLSTQLSIKDIKPLKVKVVPNPSRDFIILETDSSNKNLKLEILDATGKIIQKGTVYEKEKYDISKLTKGIYFVKISDGDRIVFEKLIKQ